MKGDVRGTRVHTLCGVCSRRALPVRQVHQEILEHQLIFALALGKMSASMGGGRGVRTGSPPWADPAFVAEYAAYRAHCAVAGAVPLEQMQYFQWRNAQANAQAAARAQAPAAAQHGKIEDVPQLTPGMLNGCAASARSLARCSARNWSTPHAPHTQQ